MPAIALENRVIIITGASRGLGRAMALAMAEAGGRLVLASPESELLKSVAHEIYEKFGAGRALAVTADITARRDCEQLIEKTLDAYGTIDVLINNARRPHRGPGLPAKGNVLPFWESDADIWQETVHVNVNGTFLLTHLVAPHMIKKGSGRIINITTSLSTMQRRHNSPYGVTKAALEAATMIWAQDLLGTGVTVNSLIPGGRVHTDPATTPPPGDRALPVNIMNNVAVWLASALSEGRTGGRYVGMLWDETLRPDEAAAGALEPPVLRPADRE
ncbi:MAG: hypothetical protein RLZ98_528 [Pseudomonadota bacterium]|jgi:3-oxoacyl-[acyl-carrier protein] reductase